MAYEPNMHIIYDAVSKSVVIVFRDALTIVGPFATSREAYNAGEQHCRDNGWNDHSQRTPDGC